MRIDIRPRGGGKTISLIQESAVHQVPIVCATHEEAVRIIRVAKESGYNIPTPIAMREVEKLKGLTHQCLVDNADWVLERFLGAKVVKATFTEDYGRIEPTF